MASTLISGDEFAALGLEHWRPMYDAIEARFRTESFAHGLEFVTRIGAAAEAADHHPDLTLTYGSVHVVLTSHDVGGKTQRDVTLARTISAIADELGIDADPASIQRAELGLDTWDRDAVKPFWQTVLALEATDDADELRDAEGVHPTVWFQESGPDTAQRWHIDLRVPPEEAPARIAGALRAGGTVVDDSDAPRCTVLADPQGNRVCVCTHVGRSH
ncbi:MAG: 4a-hydroxytetrahydrobiopterin dehydratase [Micrococcales bacterium]|nr:4a-hydroxytetrahydrobiopterin dehydratase [Micrococcales bacterium]